jgi:integrase
MARPRKARVALPLHVHAVKARGREYFYFQRFRGTPRQGERVKLCGYPVETDGTPNTAWWACYRELAGEKQQGPRAGSFAALIAAYQASPEWEQLSLSSRRDYSGYLAEIGRAWGKLLVAGVEPKHVLALRDTKAETPAAANYMIRTLSAMLSWSIPRGYRTDNPCNHVRKLKIGDGYSPWTWEQIAYFQANVTCQELWWAAALALYSGQRQSDTLTMPWSDYGKGVIFVKQEKTNKKLWIPMHRDLRTVVAGTSRAATTILTNTRGTTWTSDGFRASWRKEIARPAMAPIKKAGLVFHGLRKSAVVFLLEAGCTDGEVSSITGQSRQMVEHYAREVNQKKLAASAILKWETSDRTDPEQNL